ncbi:MAG: hypothetical protein LBI87_08195 [Candidatus Accumulibacter sp.]|jgi:hypothetical protein|nr:hypothetical protein [Accumulibacter sp.]
MTVSFSVIPAFAGMTGIRGHLIQKTSQIVRAASMGRDSALARQGEVDESADDLAMERSIGAAEMCQYPGRKRRNAFCLSPYAPCSPWPKRLPPFAVPAVFAVFAVVSHFFRHPFPVFGWQAIC